MRRKSLLPSKVIRLIGPRTTTGIICVGCGRSITEPGLCRTGGILDSPCVRTVMSSGFTKEGLSYLQSKVISFPQYVKGYLCEKCGSCYSNIRVGNEWLPLVKVDPLWGLPKPRDARVGGRSRSILNTRYTR